MELLRSLQSTVRYVLHGSERAAPERDAFSPCAAHTAQGAGYGSNRTGAGLRRSCLSLALAMMLSSPAVLAIDYDIQYEGTHINDLEAERAQALERARAKARSEISRQAQVAADLNRRTAEGKDTGDDFIEPAEGEISDLKAVHDYEQARSVSAAAPAEVAASAAAAAEDSAAGNGSHMSMKGSQSLAAQQALIRLEEQAREAMEAKAQAQAQAQAHAQAQAQAQASADLKQAQKAQDGLHERNGAESGPGRGPLTGERLVDAASRSHAAKNDAASARAAAVYSGNQNMRDPVAEKDDQPSLLRRIFGIGINRAQANPVDDISAANSRYLNLHVFGDVETLMSTADGSEELLNILPGKLDDSMLIPYESRQQAMAEELHKGISFLAYLFHMYTPQASSYRIPTFFIDAHKLSQERPGVALGRGPDPLKDGAAASASGQAHAAGKAHAEGKAPANGRGMGAAGAERKKPASEYGNMVSLTGSSSSYPLYHLSMVRDRLHTEGACAGLSYIEADLKGKCRGDQQYNGIVLLTMPIPDIQKEGIYTGVPRQITPNVLKANFFAQGMDTGARLIGFHSGYSGPEDVFTAPLHSFDRHLYSPELKQFVRENTGYRTIAPDCTPFSADRRCQLYFVGLEVNRLLSPGNELSMFNLHSRSTLNLGTPDVNIAPQALAYEGVARDALLRAQAAAEASRRASEEAIKVKQHQQAQLTDQRGIDLASLIHGHQGTASQHVPDVVARASQSTEVNAASVAAATSASAAGADKAAAHEVQQLEGAAAVLAASAEAGAAGGAATGAAAGATGAGGAGSTGGSAEGSTVDEQRLMDLAADMDVVSGHDRRGGVDEDGNYVATGYGIDKAVDLYGIPLTFTRLGRPVLMLRNTILSADQYKNYTLPVELEMALLSDLGYSLEPREFFGNSIYSFGTPQYRITRYARRPYAFYDHMAGTYNVKRPSRMPLGTGVHIYGSYNDVVHDAIVSSIGEGSVGVRIDGSSNYYWQTPGSSIVTSGNDSTGIGFTYGRDNSAYISGYVGAMGRHGVGIKVDMGSNIYSDLIEYRGSWARVRTLDYLHGQADAQEAATVPLTDDINGPAVSDLIIDGVVEGAQAAIMIDESSFVKNIHITSEAVVNGGIFSSWNPRANGRGDIILVHDGRNSALLDAVVQYPRDESTADLTARTIIDRHLTTNVNLGVLLDENNQPLMTDRQRNTFLGNEKSRVVLSGDISGSTLNVRNFAGKSTVLGNVRANRVTVYNGILSLNGPAGSINQIKTLILRSNSVLDYVNGMTSHTYVEGNIRLGRNVTIRVDADADGTPLDEISYSGKFSASNYQLTIEPGVSYIDMRRLGADPKALMNFMANFVDQCSRRFAQDGIVLRFPHYLWDNAGGYGREIKCTPKGCHFGNFASSDRRSSVTDVEPWRYWVSFIGLAVLILCFYGWYYLHWFSLSSSRKNDSSS